MRQVAPGCGWALLNARGLANPGIQPVVALAILTPWPSVIPPLCFPVTA
jgi:hypothetical protein